MPQEALSFQALRPQETARPPPADGPKPEVASNAPNSALETRIESDPWNTPIQPQDANLGRKTASEIFKLIERNHYHFSSYERAFTDPLELMVYTLHRQEEQYLAKVGNMKVEAVGASAVMLGHLMYALTHEYAIYDVLGDVYMQLAGNYKSSALGQFFTPSDVCEMMARMQLGDVKEMIAQARAEGRRLKIMDPTVGSGAMLLAAKKVIIGEVGLAGLDHFEFYGSDIDQVCVNMCKVQMCLTDYRYMTSLLMEKAWEIQRMSTGNHPESR